MADAAGQGRGKCRISRREQADLVRVVAASGSRLDISPLINVIDRLREGLARHQREPADDQLRDGLIQRFEFTYELCHRVLWRFIRQTAASPDEVDRMAFQDLIRTANRQGLLLGDWPAWHRYRNSRAKTCHAYHAETAQQVATIIPDFLAEAEYLRDALRRRLPRRDALQQQSMTHALDLSHAELTIVRDILRAHLPLGCNAYVSGSRATASARRYSDLDLALESDRPLSLDTLGEITEAVSDSDLPYKVDVIDLRSVDPAFRARIEPDMIALSF